MKTAINIKTNFIYTKNLLEIANFHKQANIKDIPNGVK